MECRISSPGLTRASYGNPSLEIEKPRRRCCSVFHYERGTLKMFVRDTRLSRVGNVNGERPAQAYPNILDVKSAKIKREIKIEGKQNKKRERKSTAIDSTPQVFRRGSVHSHHPRSPFYVAQEKTNISGNTPPSPRYRDCFQLTATVFTSVSPIKIGCSC